MNPVLLSILIVLVVLIFIGMIWALIANQKAEEKKRIMAVISGRVGQDMPLSDGDLKNKRRAELAQKLQDSEKAAGKKDGFTLKELLQQAGLDISTKRFWMLSILLSVVLTSLAKLSGVGLFVVLACSVIGLLGIPRFILKFMIQRRQKKFLDDFSDALEAVVRLLKAGMPVAEAISMISREFKGPVAEEMSMIYDAQRVGVSLGEAVLDAAKRMPIPEMQMFSVGIAIQQQTGSSLSDILQGLANVIRARYRLKRKVQALSAEAKGSAAIIGALPILVASGLYCINPGYMGVLFSDPAGHRLLMGAGTWMGMGILVMRQMINFKI